ncbi:MAG TPA: DUF4199 domain-containing protein [Ferruginibacter sp.]|nr:DUF4199 domain-containing protein [Ferruginibacter sp.]HMX36555.1 DUF4199 domain-containing protein [Ferruginibacter sp.]
MQKLNSTHKGLITGSLMIVASLVFFYAGLPAQSPVQFLIYIIYTAGIVWSVYTYQPAEAKDIKFGSYFLQGFKCFIVVTLLMVLFTIVFNKMHPEFSTQMAEAYKAELKQKGNKTPAEIEKAIDDMKNYYLPMLISSAVFGYLIMGAVISLVASLLFMKRK